MVSLHVVKVKRDLLFRKSVLHLGPLLDDLQIAKNLILVPFQISELVFSFSVSGVAVAEELDHSQADFGV
jgi:hypothetical protein